MKLREYLDLHGIKYKRFAELLGVSQTSIHNIFNGRPPSLNIAVRIEMATYGHVTCKDLCRERPTKSKEVSSLFHSKKTRNQHHNKTEEQAQTHGTQQII